MTIIIEKTKPFFFFFLSFSKVQTKFHNPESRIHITLKISHIISSSGRALYPKIAGAGGGREPKTVVLKGMERTRAVSTTCASPFLFGQRRATRESKRSPAAGERPAEPNGQSPKRAELLREQAGLRRHTQHA
jgi:hypothetical protein